MITRFSCILTILFILPGFSPANPLGVPPAPEWRITERGNGLVVSVDRIHWKSYPDRGGVIIRATGAANTRETGWPELPVYRHLFAVPPGSSPRLVTAESSTRTKTERVLPVGVWKSGPSGYTVERTDLVTGAARSRPYPRSWATIKPWGQFRGLALYALEISPLQHTLATGSLTEHQAIRCSIEWDSGRSGDAPVDDRYASLLRAMIINPGQARTMGTMKPVIRPVEMWIPPDPAVKIEAVPNSPVVITGDEIAAAVPMFAGVPASDLNLWWKGEPYPCMVETDGTGLIERIFFMSPPLPEEYKHETFKNTLWLGEGDGSFSMSGREGNPDGVPDIERQVHPVFTVTEVELLHSGYNSTGNALRWWWDTLRTTTVGQTSSTTLNFRLGEIQESAPMALTLRGYFESWRTHRIKLSLTGRDIADSSFLEGGNFELPAMVPTDYVYPGTNIVRVALIGLESREEIAHIKGIDLSFEMGFANNDTLRFRSRAEDQGVVRFSVDGFSSDDLAVFDVTDSTAAGHITNVEIESGTDGYRVTFHDSLPPDTIREYLAVALDRDVSRATLISVDDNVLADITGADYMALTPSLFEDEIQRLVDYRSSTGYEAVTIPVDDIFDRFSYGYPVSQGVADFIAWAFDSYDPTPGFVVLVGDGSARLRHGNDISPNLFPNRLIARSADDNDYVDVDQDSRRLPDLAVGRLSVQTVEHLEDYIDKIIDAETGSPPHPAHSRITFFADDANSSSHLPGFAVDCEEIIESVTPAFFPERIYLSYNGGSNNAWIDQDANIRNPFMLESRAKGEAHYRPWIIESLTEGTLLFTYVGHGGINTWATEWIITTDDAPEMLTAPNYPVISNFSCDTGRFDDPDYDIIMSENFTRWREGALAYFSAARESYPNDNEIISINFHKAILNWGLHEVGLAVQTAKFQSEIPYVCRTYILLGDPASRLSVPDTDDIQVTVSPSSGSTGTEMNGSITWDTVQDAEGVYLLEDAHAKPLAMTALTDLELPATLSGLATLEAPPSGTGLFKVYTRSGSEERVGYANFTCPANIDTGIVSPETGTGGWVSSRDGNVLFSIPEGAVTESTVVRISSRTTNRIDSQRRMDFAPLPGSPERRSYEIELDSWESLGLPATLAVAYDPNWLLDVDEDSLQIGTLDLERNLWLGIGGRTVSNYRVRTDVMDTGMYTVLVVYDTEPPRISRSEIFQNDIWLEYRDGEFVQEGDIMRLTIVDAEGINGDSIAVSVHGTSLPVSYEARDETHQEANLLFTLPSLDDGTHDLMVGMTDIYGNSTVEQLSLRSTIGLEVAGFAPIPSPFSRSTHFRFVLSEDAGEAVVSVYTVTGRLIKRLSRPSPSRGTNVIAWNGRDEDGDRIAGGVYLVRLTVDAANGTVSADTKVVKRPS